MKPIADKASRQEAIRSIIKSPAGSTHEKIGEQLRQQDIVVSQSTLSRDLREMGAVKVPRDSGFVYTLGGTEQAVYPLDAIGSAMVEFSIEYEAIGNFLVIKTTPGKARDFCLVLDRQKWNEMVGTLAGDDTILVIARTASDIVSIIGKLKQSTGKGTI